MDLIGKSSNVVMQIGCSTYKPVYASYFDYDTEENLLSLVHSSDVVVSHAGVGSTLAVLKYRKPLIIVPRLSSYGEHYDDHQLDLAEFLSNANIARACLNLEQLDALIKDSLLNVSYTQQNSLTESLSSLLDKWNSEGMM